MKKGRPHKPYRTSWGENIDGLRRRSSDGRWVIVQTGKMFSEADERRAVNRFRQWQAEQKQAEITIATFRRGRRASGKRWKGLQHRILPTAQGTVRPSDYDVFAEIPEPELWAWFREQLIKRPEYVAEQVDIPEVARLANLPTPKPSPTLDEVGTLYVEKPGLSEAESKKAKTRWAEFVKAVKVRTLRELSVENVNVYGDGILETIKKKNLSPVYARQRFGLIKTVLNHSRRRGLNPDDVRHALDCCAVLVPPKARTPNPEPISREHFATLLDAADVEMKAALLLALNLCMYPSEVAALEWSEIDLAKKAVLTHRNKTSIIRVGVLWDRTVKALEAVEGNRSGFVFKSDRIHRLNDATMRKRFWRLRKACGLDGDKVQFQHIRDGAYTAAAETDVVDLAHVRALAGHSSGISDHYLARHPRIVAKAVAGIEAVYFG
ncbi:tyrosine-type recombinase/integrase [Phycisphaerales bacterium AB-hyl4]|uniref:Tyrosine-type recombinase/integrase n=1 Tax=Natronomicrosphaera hydrolytica TaxID=3242702 RepID=A0ABV4UA01_9BACT